MTRGKYANGAEARAARETAIQEATEAATKAANLQKQLDLVTEQRDSLRKDFGTKVQAAHNEWRAKVAEAQAETAEAVEQLGQAEKAFKRAVNLIARELVTRGVDPGQALTGTVDLLGGIIDKRRFHSGEGWGLAIDPEAVEVQGVVYDKGRGREDVRVSRMRTQQVLNAAAVMRVAAR